MFLKGEKSFLKQTQINTNTEFGQKYPCVPKHPQAKKVKQPKVLNIIK